MDEQHFRQEIAGQGYEQPELIEREANLYNAEHVHDFDVSVLIISGELTVTASSAITTCRAGDRFALDGGIEHTEQYGPNGTKLLVGKRHHER